MERWQLRLHRTASAITVVRQESSRSPPGARPFDGVSSRSHPPTTVGAGATQERTPVTVPRTTADLGLHPTGDAQTALRQLRNEGFCVLSGVLDDEQVTALRQEVLANIDNVASVLADAEESPANRLEGLKYYYPEALGLDGTPGKDGGGVVAPEHMGNRAISGYVRFAPHWANRGCETPLVSKIVSSALGEHYKMVYTTAFSSHSRAAVRWVSPPSSIPNQTVGLPIQKNVEPHHLELSYAAAPRRRAAAAVR